MKAKTKKKPVGKTKTANEILKENSRVFLDLACGESKREGYIGMDSQPYPGVDIVHNALVFPWPIADNSIDHIVSSHFLEHVTPLGVDPRLMGLIDLLIDKKVIKKAEAMKYFGEHHIFSNFISLMDEIWRVLKPGGQFAFVGPHWESIGFAQDPTHIKMLCEATVMYFDPEHESNLWRFYKPMPWKIEMQSFSSVGNIEVVLSKRDIAPYEAAIKASGW